MTTDNSELTTNLVFTSNVYIVKEREIRLDSRFLSKIHDFKALEIFFDEKFPPTRDQKREHENASITCSYVDDRRDYVWGTVINKDGFKIKACTCTKTDCYKFSECRPGISIDELKHYNNNQHIHLGMDSE